MWPRLTLSGKMVGIVSRQLYQEASAFRSCELQWERKCLTEDSYCVTPKRGLSSRPRLESASVFLLSPPLSGSFDVPEMPAVLGGPIPPRTGR